MRGVLKNISAAVVSGHILSPEPESGYSAFRTLPALALPWRCPELFDWPQYTGSTGIFSKLESYWNSVCAHLGPKLESTTQEQCCTGILTDSDFLHSESSECGEERGCGGFLRRQ